MESEREMQILNISNQTTIVIVIYYFGKRSLVRIGKQNLDKEDNYHFFSANDSYIEYEINAGNQYRGLFILTIY